MYLDKVISRKFPESMRSYQAKDTILYALGVGLGAEPLNPHHLRFLYEDGLIAMPTMANVLGQSADWVREPQYGIDWRRLVHAEHRLTMHAAVPPEGSVVTRNSLVGVRDKGTDKGSIVHLRQEMMDAATGLPLATIIATLMLRGDGGCGDYGDAPSDLEAHPERAPDASIETMVDEILPLIYRLSGDYNPLHIDPEIATIAGFSRPIFHGLGTMGMAAFAILKTYCAFDPNRLKGMEVRFSRPVLPGDKVRFNFWRDKTDTVRFNAIVSARDVVVLDRGTATIS